MAEYCNDRFELVEDNEDSFGMWQGLVGPHYTPIMSNDGTLSWTNNGFLPNPDSVNLRGPQGAGLTIAGIRESTAGLPESAAAGVVWLVGTEEPYEGYSYINDEWIDLGPMTVGPAGPPGPQGDDYTLTSADKTEIAGEAEQLLLNDLNNNPLPVTKGGTGAQTLAGAQENLGIKDLADQIGDTPLATDAQDIRGAINELVGDLGSLDFDTSAQDVTGAVNELQADKVAKAGDTMTGNLQFDDTGVYFESDTQDQSASSRDSNDDYIGLRYLDKNGNVIGQIYQRQFTTGELRLSVAARRRVGSSDVYNSFNLGIQNDGTRNVVVSEAAPWRSALGLGNASGALPITVAQGGTGQTAVSAETTVANVVTAGTGVTIVGVEFCQWGKMAMIDITVKLSTAVTTAADTKVATLKSGYIPKYYCAAVTRASGASYSYIEGANGTGGVHIYGTIPANTNIHILATYILA